MSTLFIDEQKFMRIHISDIDPGIDNVKERVKLTLNRRIGRKGNFNYVFVVWNIIVFLNYLSRSYFSPIYTMVITLWSDSDGGICTAATRPVTNSIPIIMINSFRMNLIMVTIQA
jgi:hypothetical protein